MSTSNAREATREWLSTPEKGLVRSVRAGQIKLADIVGATIEEKGIAFAEAGTGTGKTFAYLVPALLSGKRVVVSTAKKALQEQIVDTDLPRLVALLRPPGASYSLLKGKSNYFCALRWEEFRDSPQGLSVDPVDLEAFEAEVQALRGDVSGVNSPHVAHARTSECVRKGCPHAEGCAYVDARERAKSSRVLVVNHALLAQDLALGGGKLFGEYEVLIIDEGHQAPQFFRDAFSLSLTPRQPETLAKLMRDTAYLDAEELARLYGRIYGTLPAQAQRFRPSEAQLSLLTALRVQITACYDKLDRAGLINPDPDDMLLGGAAIARERAKLQSAATMVTKIKQLCDIVTGEHPRTTDVEWIAYVDKKQRDEVQLVVTPLEIGPLVAPALLGVGRVVVTSATLATASGMDFMAREYGFNKTQLTHAAVLPSPFDYANRSALYVSKTSPDPVARDPNYYAAMAGEIHELLRASRGGAFVLCASNDDLDALHEQIYKRFAPHPYQLARQNPKIGTEALVRWFSEGKDRVLMGLKTFWEGIDVPGDGLRLVIIPRLPFPNRNDVVLTARKERYQRMIIERDGLDADKASIRSWDAFDFQIAVMDVKQGAGRLIRTELDLGIIALLDRRAEGRTKAYSPKIRNALPHPELDPKTCDPRATVLALLQGFARKALGA